MSGGPRSDRWWGALWVLASRAPTPGSLRFDHLLISHKQLAAFALNGGGPGGNRGCAIFDEGKGASALGSRHWTRPPALAYNVMHDVNGCYLRLELIGR